MRPYVDTALRWVLYGLAHRYRGGLEKGGGVRALAEDLGVSFSLLSRWIAPDEQEDPRFIPAERLTQFCRLTGSREPLDYLASRLGCIAAPLPTARQRSGEELLDFFSQCGKTSEAVRAFFDEGGDRKTALRSLDALLRLAAAYRVAVRNHTPDQMHLPTEETAP